MPQVRRPLSSVSAALTACVLVTGGCAGLGSSTASSSAAYVDLDSPAMRDFPVAAMTDLERDVRIETGSRKNEKLTPALFWTGIGVGTLTSVGAIAFGVAGYVTKTQLNDGYQGQTTLTLDERDRLVSNGELYNNLAIAFTAIAVISYALSIVTYGVDWNRCGPLAQKKRRCKELGLYTF